MKKKLNIWIVNPYGTLPSEGWREYRSSMLARALAVRGHQVVWWISNFEHRSKNFRKSGLINDPLLVKGITILSVECDPYSKNISISRIKYEKSFGKNFKVQAESMIHPDVTIIADPSLFYSKYIIAYLKNKTSKIIVDVLDLWPEQFHVALPRFLRHFGKLLFCYLYYKRNCLVRIADGIVAVSKNHLNAVKAPKGKPKLVAYLGVNRNNFIESNSDVSDLVADFANNSELVITYAGTLGEAYDIHTVIKAVKLTICKNNKVKFIFAGDGPYSKQISLLSKRLSTNVLFLGKVSSDELPNIYRHCQVGICSYSPASTVTMPVKLYDYLASGLYIFYSTDGEIDEILTRNSCGTRYRPNKPTELSQLILEYLTKTAFMFKRDMSLNLAANFDEKLQHDRYAQFIEDIYEI